MYFETSQLGDLEPPKGFCRLFRFFEIGVLGLIDLSQIAVAAVDGERALDCGMSVSSEPSLVEKM